MDNWYDRNGNPLGEVEGIELLLRDPTYKRVARSKVTSAADPTASFDVSTVWLGLDYSFGQGIPLIFETMVFAEGSGVDLDCRRYPTEAAAMREHVEVVVSVAATLTDPIVMDAEESATSAGLTEDGAQRRPEGASGAPSRRGDAQRP